MQKKKNYFTGEAGSRRGEPVRAVVVHMPVLNIVFIGCQRFFVIKIYYDFKLQILDF